MASGPGTQGRLTRYSASATSECRRNIKNHSNRLKGAREVTGHKLLQKRICSLPEGHVMGRCVQVRKSPAVLIPLYMFFAMLPFCTNCKQGSLCLGLEALSGKSIPDQSIAITLMQV